MAPRWRTLSAVALSVLIFDQWTKLLAVKHLTPAFTEAAARASGRAPVRGWGSDAIEEAEQLLDAMGPLAQLQTFYTVRSPCLARAISCPPVHVFDGFWDWRYAENPGAAWSMFAQARPEFRRVFLVGISLGAVVFILLFLRKVADTQHVLILALSLVLGGAIGNLIDRARLGYVVDFIDWYAGTHHWPTFNVADSAISSGIALLAINMLLELRPKRPRGDLGTDSEPLASSER